MKKQRPDRKAKVVLAVLAVVVASFAMSASAYSSGTWSNLFPPKGKFALAGGGGGGPLGPPELEGGPIIIVEGGGGSGDP